MLFKRCAFKWITQFLYYLHQVLTYLLKMVSRLIFHTNIRSTTQKRMIPKCSNLVQRMFFGYTRSGMVLGLKGQRSRLELGLGYTAIQRKFELYECHLVSTMFSIMSKLALTERQIQQTLALHCDEYSDRVHDDESSLIAASCEPASDDTSSATWWLRRSITICLYNNTHNTCTMYISCCNFCHCTEFNYLGLILFHCNDEWMNEWMNEWFLLMCDKKTN